MKSQYLGEITVKIKGDDSSMFGVSQYFLDPNEAMVMWKFLRANETEVEWMKWKDNFGSNRCYPAKTINF